MSYEACDVAEYIIFYSHSKDYSISNLRLQKLLYFIQEEFYKIGRNCFDDEIEYWDCGPIIEDVYRQYKVYSGGNIPGFIAKNPSDITDDDKTLIASVVDRYKCKSTVQLDKIIYTQQS